MASSVKIISHLLGGFYSFSESIQRGAKDEIFSVESDFTLLESKPLLPDAIRRNSLVV